MQSDFRLAVSVIGALNITVLMVGRTQEMCEEVDLRQRNSLRNQNASYVKSTQYLSLSPKVLVSLCSGPVPNLLQLNLERLGVNE